LADPASKAPRQLPKKSHAARNVGIVLVMVAVLVIVVVSGGLGSSNTQQNLQNLPAKQVSVVQDYVNEVNLTATEPAWAGPSTPTSVPSYNWVVVIQNTGKTAITSVVAGVVLTGNTSCTICANHFQIKAGNSSLVGQSTPLTSEERATYTQTFIPSVVNVNPSPYPVSITITYADGTQSTLDAMAPLCQTASCQNQSGGSTTVSTNTSTSITTAASQNTTSSAA
jgi:hypothetical protein